MATKKELALARTLTGDAKWALFQKIGDRAAKREQRAQERVNKSPRMQEFARLCNEAAK